MRVAGQQHGGGDGAGAGHQRNGQRIGGDIVDMLGERFLGGLGVALQAHAEHHFRGDREQKKAAGDAEGGQGNAHGAEQPLADERGAGQNGERIDGGAKGDGALRRRVEPRGRGDEHRREAERLDDDEQSDEGRDEIVDIHPGLRWGTHPAR